MTRDTGKADICYWCRREIYEDEDTEGKGPGRFDWYTDKGDYGCDKHPHSNEEGVCGHLPGSRRDSMNDICKDALHYFADAAAAVKSKLTDEQLQSFLETDLEIEDENIILKVDAAYQESFYEWERIIQQVLNAC